MELSEILNVVFGGGLLGAVVSIVTIRSALRKARADADKALAESDTVKITNTEQATRILIENIVEPLKNELNETRKEVCALKREMARFRKAVASANSCRYSDDCPVLERMRDAPKGGAVAVVSGQRPHLSGGVESGQCEPSERGQHDGGAGNKDGGCEGGSVGCEPDFADGQPP